MAIPGPAELEKTLLSASDLSKASLATRIVVGRLRTEVKNAPGDLAAKVAELRQFATENSYAADDLANI